MDEAEEEEERGSLAIRGNAFSNFSLWKER